MREEEKNQENRTYLLFLQKALKEVGYSVSIETNYIGVSIETEPNKYYWFWQNDNTFIIKHSYNQLNGKKTKIDRMPKYLLSIIKSLKGFYVDENSISSYSGREYVHFLENEYELLIESLNDSRILLNSFLLALKHNENEKNEKELKKVFYHFLKKCDFLKLPIQFGNFKIEQSNINGLSKLFLLTNSDLGKIDLGYIKSNNINDVIESFVSVFKQKKSLFLINNEKNGENK